MPGITPNLGVYATEPDADPVGDWLASCARLAALAARAPPGAARPPAAVPRPAGAARRAWSATRRRRLAGSRYLATPRRASECFAPLYGRPIGAAEYGLALAEAVGHLNHLTHAGEAVRRLGADGAWLWQARRNGA